MVGRGQGPDRFDARFFHWLSALVALPAVAYSGMPFFESAVRALRQRSINMDVPITLGVLLRSYCRWCRPCSTPDAYFDSGVMLVLFLLAGRYLDQRMRRRTGTSRPILPR